VDRKKSRSLLVTAQLTDFFCKSSCNSEMCCYDKKRIGERKKKDYKITRVREKPRERAKKNAKFSIVSCMIREPLFLDTLEAVLKSFSYQFS
jgi:hypothetical protein